MKSLESLDEDEIHVMGMNEYFIFPDALLLACTGVGGYKYRNCRDYTPKQESRCEFMILSLYHCDLLFSKVVANSVLLVFRV